MKRKLFYAMAAALCLLPMSVADPPAFSAEPAVALQNLPAPKADPIRIVVPADMVPGEDYDLPVSGLSVNDLVPGRVLFLPPEATNVRCKLTVVWSLAGLEPQIAFRAKLAGNYRIVIVKSLPQEQLMAAVAIVTVKGDVPPPDPPDPPGPGPTPKKPRCLIIEEQSQRTAAQAVVLSSAKVRAAFSGGFVVEDKDVKDASGKTPTALQPFIDTATKAGLPYLFIFGDDGKLWKEGKLPAVADDVLALLKGGKS